LIVSVVLAVAMQADIDRQGVDPPGDLQERRVMDAERYPIMLQQLKNIIDQPAWIAELNNMALGLGQDGQEVLQPG